MSGRGMDAASTRRGRALAILLLLEGAMAHSEYRSRIPNGEVVPGVNALGHANLKGGGMLNAFGKDFKAAGYAWTTELCKKDSDGDGQSNGKEKATARQTYFACLCTAGKKQQLFWTTGNNISCQQQKNDFFGNNMFCQKQKAIKLSRPRHRQ